MVAAAQASSARDELNRQLPSWMTVGGEIRLRSEGTRGPVNQPAGDHDFILQRTRMSLALDPVNWLHFFGEAQDARSYGLSQVNGTIRDTVDVRQAYAMLGSEGGWWDVKAGRQVLAYGSERLMGGSNWTNTARAFDGVKLTLRHKRDWVDAFASSVVNNDLDDWDHHQAGNNLHGIYGSVASLLPGARIEPYVFYRGNHAAGSYNWTGGARVAGAAKGGWSYELDLLRQAGDTGRQRLSGWATTLQVQRQIRAFPWNFAALGEFNYATGDRNPNDNESNTLDQLYPTNHSIYGIVDMIGRRNAENARIQLGVQPRTWLTVRGAVHSFWLASRYDALYMANGAVAVPAQAGGAATRDVGREVDFTGDLKLSRFYEIGLQYGHLFPGSFLRVYGTSGGRDFYAAWIDLRL